MSKSGISAEDIVNTFSENELSDIFFRFGEEKFSRKIASQIVKVRSSKKITSTLQLADIIANAVPASARRNGHPARKCFQAIRIAVNGELDRLNEALDKAFNLLNKDGVLAIITFHSLEDRMVKQRFKEFTSGCTCPPDFPVCVCGKIPKGHLLSRKPIEPSESELEINPRSRSAKLRVIVRN
jgi:16S rRNA (cytosine1402-N4)-methyltransferase